jgi:acetyltransferase-like isoleucine patch superfamily enzyme
MGKALTVSGRNAPLASNEKPGATTAVGRTFPQVTETPLTDSYRVGVDPFMEPPGGDSRVRNGLIELRQDAARAARWCRRGPVATTPLLPQVLRRWLLRKAGVRFGKGASGMERCWFESDVSIGENTYINARTWFEGHGHTSIGSFCLFGPGVLILTSDHARGPDGLNRATEYHDVKIGDRCLIGAHAVIMSGVTIGDDVVVGAGTIVTKDLPAGGTYAGVPARRIR